MSAKDINMNFRQFFLHGLITVVLILIATVINYNIVLLYDKTINVSGVYLLAIITVSLLTGSYFWGTFSALCSVVGTNFCFTYPYFAIDFSLTGYPLTFLIMAAVAVVTCALTVNMRKQRDEAHRREQMAQLLNEMDRKLLQMDTKEQIVTLLLDSLYTQLERPIFYLERQGECLVCLGRRGEAEATLPEICDKTVQQSLEQKKNIHSEISGGQKEVCLSIPVMWQQRIFGAACILLREEVPTKEVREYAQGLVNHFAIAFDRQALSETQQRILVEKQAEQTRGYLLRAISHDLRTPLTSILGASGAILENADRMQEDIKRRLMQDIHEEARWLLRMIENVLSVTKIGNYNPELDKTLEPVEEVIADSVARSKKYFPDLKIEIHLPDELIMLPMDPILIRQVVTNLVDNAYRHGNSQEKIELNVHTAEDYAEFSVQDYGQGLPPEDLKQIFCGFGGRKQKDGDTSRGLGLGMSICKTIIEAHNGQIFAENVAGKGLKVTFRLPMEEIK